MWITKNRIRQQVITFSVYARTGKGKRHHSLSKREWKVSSWARKFKTSWECATSSPRAELVFAQCACAEENVVGQVNKVTLCMMRNLEIERIGLAAMSLGIARCASTQFLNRMRAVEQHLEPEIYSNSADPATGGRKLRRVHGGALLCVRKCALFELDGNVDADGTKLLCANMSKQVADRAIQVMGGYGYVGEYKVERLWRDAKTAPGN